jgi:hypothetical protein
MALADPQSFDSATLNLIKPEPTRSTYATADGTERFIVSYQEDKQKTRYLVRGEKDVIATDPITGASVKKTLSAYMVIDQPVYGFTDTEAKDFALAIGTWLSASSAANLVKVLGNQH